MDVVDLSVVCREGEGRNAGTLGRTHATNEHLLVLLYFAECILEAVLLWSRSERACAENRQMDALGQSVDAA